MAEQTRISNFESRLNGLDRDENGREFEDYVFLPENRPNYHKYTTMGTLRALLLVNYDPFSVYKGTNHVSHQAKYRLYLSEELRIKQDDYATKFARNRNIIKNVILTYSMIKYTTIGIVQIMKYKIVEDYKSKSSSTSNNEYKNDQTFKFFDSLGNLIGNPLSALTGISLMIYSSFIVGFAYSAAYLPYRFSYNPVNAVNLRFMLDPLREIKRIDILIRNKLDEYATFINTHKFPVKENPLNLYAERLLNYKPISYRNQLNIYDTNRNEDELIYLDKQMEILNNERSNVWKMRPNCYSSNSYKSLHFDVIRIQIISLILGALILSYLPKEIFLRSAIGKCQIKYSRDNCRIFEAFNWKDILALVEILIGIFILGVIIAFEVITIISNTFCQMRLIRNMRENLNDYLNDIRTFNRMKDDLANFKRNKPTLNENEFISKFDEHLMGKMLRYLIKITLSEKDLKINAVYLTQIVESFVITFAMGLLSSLFASRLNGLDIKPIRTTVLLLTFLGANAILFTCAFVYARIIDIEKLGWSLLAQNSIRVSFENTRCNPVENDIFSTGWRKLILSEELSDKRNAVCLFGLNINFKRILELDFLVISLMSLLC